MRMEENHGHMTEKILNLTLEIIYLLTGERFPLVKSGDHMTITVPPCDSLKPERHNMEKILEVTKKMMELLTGEVRRILGILGHYPVTDKGCVWMVTVSLCVSGSYKVSGCHCLFLHGGVGVFRRTQGSLQGRHDGQSAAPHITGYGSSNGNPPERCPRPLYSRDSTQEDHIIPHHHQSGNLGDYTNVVKEEFIEEDQKYGVRNKYSEGHKNMKEPHNYGNPPERCPRPLYSRDSTQEDHTIPHCYKGEDLIYIKVEVKSEEEERYVRDDQQSMEEDGITGTFIEEDTPTEISTGGSLTLNTFLHPYCSLIGPDYKVRFSLSV
ncbi:uncharacterized protein [Aquarana catesbeiana]|uniref:uncharacterized protein n=1 Tax=Aquarana catesbeiana TaxID=8400 RepID=UPI003CC923F0